MLSLATASAVISVTMALCYGLSMLERLSAFLLAQ